MSHTDPTSSPSRQHLLAALHWADMTVRAELSRHMSESDGATQVDRQRAIAVQRLRRVESDHTTLPMQILRARWHLEIVDELLLWLAVGAVVDHRIDQMLGATAWADNLSRQPGQVPRALAAALFCDNRAEEVWLQTRLLIDRPLTAAGLLEVSPDAGTLAASPYAVAMLAGHDVPGLHRPGVFAPDQDSAAPTHCYWVERARAEAILEREQWAIFDQLVASERTRAQRADRPAALCLIAGPAVGGNRALAEILATALHLPIQACSLAGCMDESSGATVAHLEAVVARVAGRRSLLMVTHADALLGTGRPVGAIGSQRRAALGLAALARHRGPVALIADSAVEPARLAAHELADKLAIHLRPALAAG